MISPFFFRLPPLRALGLAFGLLALLPSLHAHRPFEITSVGRLQHGRLELTVTVSLVMANYLLRDPARPEAPPVDADNFETHREALLRLAPGFFTVNDGPAPLRPEKILLMLNTSGEPEFHFVYPPPAAGPLLIRAPGLRAPGVEGNHLVRILDADDGRTPRGVGEVGEIVIAVSVPLTPVPARVFTL